MENTSANCAFCRNNGLLAATVLGTTQHAYVIENTFSPGNFLIIPEAHITEVGELPDTWWADFKALLTAIPNLTADYNVSLNIGALAGQTQPHLHFWVVPRTQDMAAPGKGLVGLMNLVETTHAKITN